MKAVFQKLIDTIPDYKGFFTVDEMDNSSKRLAEQYPECVSITEIGKSGSGNPLYCLKIGHGERNALFLGCPHPNEPIGAALLEHFTWSLAANKELQDELGYTCYVVKAWDCDGVRLNEKWLKGPFTITNYSRNFYRPVGFKQVDWTFPIDYKELHFNNAIPETRAVMRLIDEIRPSFIYSLHNAGFGGVYWYISHDMPEIHDEMYAAANRQQVPLNLGEPESPYCHAYAPAIYQKTTIRDNYDYLEQNGAKEIGKRIKTGTCSADYGEEVCGAFTLLTELPYFFDKRISDMSESKAIRRDVAEEKLNCEEQYNNSITALINESEAYIDKQNPFMVTLRDFASPKRNDATRKMISVNPAFAKHATIAEEFSNLLVAKFYKLLQFGMLVRMHESELENMKKTGEEDPCKRAALECGMQKALTMFNELAEYLEAEIHYEVVPIRKLVAIQLESGLLTMQYLKDHK